MIHYIETALEFLAGINSPGTASLVKDHTDRTLIKSIAAQTSKGLGLTDRQLAVAIRKIEKYEKFLINAGVDVASLLEKTPLRIEKRQIDRSISISVSVFPNEVASAVCAGDPAIVIKAPWSANQFNIEPTVIGQTFRDKSLTYIPLNEQNIYLLLTHYLKEDAEIDTMLLAAFDKINDIRDDRLRYVPHLDLVDAKLVAVNISATLRDYIDKNIQDKVMSPIEYAAFLKQCGVYEKTSRAIQHLVSLTNNELTEKIITSAETRFRINPDFRRAGQVVSTVAELNQWPLLVLVDEHTAYDTVKSMHSEISNFVSNKEITVFFRLPNGKPNYLEFNDFVKDNRLNNYIDDTIKVVFIIKNKIPKPLLTSTWSPSSALLMSGFEYGKVASYLNNFPTVYYYNNSIFQHKNLLGFKQIVEL